MKKIMKTNDCVSREKVVYMITNGKYANENYEQFIDRLIKELGALPAVKPARKVGKWIKYSFQRAGEQHYQCTNCKDYVNFGAWGDYYTKNFKYCPHCGARMEDEE
jgi:DNA-directed RNA polymerase subunit RPC12/RpoP